MSGEQNRMRNTHLLPGGFEYVRPATVDEAIAALQCRSDARVLAGGTNLLVDAKLERVQPSCVIDITQLPAFRGIADDGSSARIGALTPIRDLAVSGDLWRRHTCLAESAAAFGSTQVAMMGTIGGNIANGSPASDTVPALVVLGAQAVIAGPGGERKALVADLLKGPGDVALESGELIRWVVLPDPPAGQAGSSFLKLSRVRADLAKVSVAVWLEREGNTIVRARIALGSVGPTVLRAKRASSVLAGKPFSKDLILNAARMAADEIKPIDDVRSTAAYRRRAAVALTHDALMLAWERASVGLQEVPRGEPVEGGIQREGGAQSSMNVRADQRTTISLAVNGKPVTLDVAPNDLLLNMLRDRLALTGAKYGCGIGECGACTVWLNGVPVLGCLVLAVCADGGDVRTIEGEADGGRLSDLQQAFIDENAFQCGYCTPGMLMMTKKLLAEIPEPTEDEIRDYLKGNHCRCTGYASIVRAVNRATGREES